MKSHSGQEQRQVRKSSGREWHLLSAIMAPKVMSLLIPETVTMLPYMADRIWRI